MPPHNDHSELKALILENQRLLGENNELLKKMHKSAVRHLWLNVIWIIFLLGAPLVLLYQFILPMYESIGTNPGSFSEQLKEVNELRSFLEEQR